MLGHLRLRNDTADHVFNKLARIVADLLPRETLLHFCARLGLQHLATFLIDQAGGRRALEVTNHNDELPAEIARSAGLDALAKILSG